MRSESMEAWPSAPRPAGQRPVPGASDRSRGRQGEGVALTWCAPAVQDLVARARREVVAAEAATTTAERFRHAHLAALRAGAAVLAMRGEPARRGRPRSVWDLLATAAPELRAWAAYFRGGAPLRAAIESGRDPAVSDAQAEHALGMARMFLDVVAESSLARAS